MQGQFFKIDSPDQIAPRLEFLSEWLREHWNWEKPVCLQPQPYRQNRKLSQNALYQVWAREFAAHTLKKAKAEVTDLEHKAMKITLQRHGYAAGMKYLVIMVADLFTGTEKPQRRSTSDLDTGEMFAYMEWVQATAAEQGLILESTGEYDELRRGQQ